MSDKLVSVIIPVYNVVIFLEESLQSVLADDYACKEIIVVNDGSNQQAAAKITSLCAIYPQVKLVNQTNRGQALARASGIKHSRGDYIIFLDADDKLLPGAVTYLAMHMDANPGAVAVYGTKILINDKGERINQRVFPGADEVVSGDVLPALLKGITLFSHGNICMRREFISKVEFPGNIRQGEDWVTWCRLALMGDIIYIGDKPLLCWRGHADNVSNEVFDDPSALYKMLDTVFKDPVFIASFGKKILHHYRQQHLRQIHSYLRYCYRDRKQYWQARKHQFIVDYILPKPPKKKIKVLHVVKWFYAGGCERLLSGLMANSDPEQFEYVVVSLSDQNERMGDVQRTLNIPYKSFEFPYGKMNLRQHVKCLLYIRSQRPDVIKTWLPPANISGGIIARLLRKPLIWGIHNVHIPPYAYDVRLQTKLAPFLPDAVICCSQPAYDACKALDYGENRLKIIINGTDLNLFRFAPEGRKRIRQELAIADDTLLIGMAAEGTLLKRHPHFIKAAKQFALTHPNVQFLLCGKFVTPDNHIFMDQIKALGMEKHIHLLGVRNDMPDIYSALDIHTLNSSREPFGLAVTEAMCCETLCVATDVDVMGELLQDVGILYAPSDDPVPLVNAWQQIIALPEHEKNARRKKGRERIAQKFPLSKTARAYEETYRQVLGL